MDDTFTSDTFLTPVLLLLAEIPVLLAIIAWAYYRWRRLKPELFPPAPSEELLKETGPSANGNSKHDWARDVAGIIGGMHRMLERSETNEAKIALEATRKLEGAAPRLSESIQSVLAKSVETAELHSLLVRAQGLYGYIVVVPNRHEHPHLIRRYESFSAGWTQHASLVRASLMSSGPFSALIVYLFFVSPDAKDGVLLVSYADAQTMVVPRTLVQATDVGRTEAQHIEGAFEFRLSSATVD